MKTSVSTHYVCARNQLFNTHAFHLPDSEEASSHQHTERDGQDEDEGQGQRGTAGLHCPQDAQANNLD